MNFELIVKTNDQLKTNAKIRDIRKCAIDCIYI